MSPSLSPSCGGEGPASLWEVTLDVGFGSWGWTLEILPPASDPLAQHPVQVPGPGCSRL